MGNPDIGSSPIVCVRSRRVLSSRDAPQPPTFMYNLGGERGICLRTTVLYLTAFLCGFFQSGLCSSSELATSRGSIRIQHLTSAAALPGSGIHLLEGDLSGEEKTARNGVSKIAKFIPKTDISFL